MLIDMAKLDDKIRLCSVKEIAAACKKMLIVYG